jgi:hypothetical protein
MIRQFRTAARDARKLNIVTVDLSPRPQEVNFTIRQLCNLTFYGKFSPQDATYVDRECLQPLRKRGVEADSGNLLDLVTGEFLTIIGTQAQTVKVTQRRMTRHGAETPKLEYETPKTEQTKKAVTDLAETIQKALEKERLEGSELDKEKEKAKKLLEVVETQTKEIERLRQIAETLGKIKIETQKPEMSGIEQSHVQDFLKGLKIELIETFDQEVKHFLPSIPQENHPIESKQIYDTWAPKLPHAAKRILKLLAIDKKGLHMTKREIAVALGYRTTSGTFNGAISTLKRNHLIKADGSALWVE